MESSLHSVEVVMSITLQVSSGVGFMDTSVMVVSAEPFIWRHPTSSTLMASSPLMPLSI